MIKRNLTLDRPTISLSSCPRKVPGARSTPITLSTGLVVGTRRSHPTSILSSMGRYHSTSDAHFEVGDRVLVRGVPACVRMETATQVLVVFDAESQEEWVPKSSPALTLARDAASSAATSKQIT